VGHNLVPFIAVCILEDIVTDFEFDAFGTFSIWLYFGLIRPRRLFLLDFLLEATLGRSAALEA
jgi:hypothetical protein